MFFGLGIIGVLSSYLASAFITRERRRASKIVGEREQYEDEENDEERDKQPGS
jgi:hypothetical protein